MFNEFKNKISSITDAEKNVKEKKEMTQDECFELIESWGEQLEVRLSPDDFEDVKFEIWKAVQKERLTFDFNEEIFRYVMKKPIRDKDGNVIISQLKIHETIMEQKRGISKKKDDVDTMASMFSAYCKDDEMNEIPYGFLTRIADRDQSIISAVILGFFVQAVPSRKSAD